MKFPLNVVIQLATGLMERENDLFQVPVQPIRELICYLRGTEDVDWLRLNTADCREYLRAQFPSLANIDPKPPYFGVNSEKHWQNWLELQRYRVGLSEELEIEPMPVTVRIEPEVPAIDALPQGKSEFQPVTVAVPPGPGWFHIVDLLTVAWGFEVPWALQTPGARSLREHLMPNEPFGVGLHIAELTKQFPWLDDPGIAVLLRGHIRRLYDGDTSLTEHDRKLAMIGYVSSVLTRHAEWFEVAPVA